ncbi:MAG: NADH-quinone oxidoreductase subunit J [Verrucomicrobia bacterium]|nr:NADH-quinone oxidoreductase subunit J [Verrucomicrobiota bacterium]
MSAFPAADRLVAGIFLLFVATTVAGSVLAVFTTRIIRSVCGLALASIGLAGLYYFLHSPFLALMEILIYIGAVCVTIIFAVMLAEPDEPRPDKPTGRSILWWLGAIVVSGAIFWSVARLGLMGNWPTPAIDRKDGSVHDIGVALLTTYSLAFEVISLVLMVAILGAVAIARSGRHHE